MRLTTLIADDFLTQFDRVREFADGANYQSIVNEVDGTEYPLICRAPDFVVDLARSGAEKLFGQKIAVRDSFFRASPLGVAVPNQVHNDISMGEWGLVIYVNRDKDCSGGTSFVRHKEFGFISGPTNENEIEAAFQDRNIPDKWIVEMTCPMAENRALIFPAELMHRSEPVGGFGSGVNARVALMAFFDLP